MEYATLEARLKTFEPPTKRSKAGWPHKAPSAEAVAAAGFYYRPNRTGDDNVVCYLCDRYLDGWEKDDDPVAEHLQHSAECGFAIMAGIASQEDHEPSQMEDPTGQRLENARRATFANWPHEGKRGWTCKIEKMVEAGWHFTPTYECEDFTSCAYCKLCLDGWEPKDNPFEEHYRRSPGCHFFIFAGSTAPSKRPKAKKGRTSRSSKASRTSKASTRLSTQSQVSTQDIPDLDDSIDTSNTSLASNTSKASTMSKTKRKAAGGARSTRAKKAKVSVQAEPEPEPEVELLDPATIDLNDPIDQSTTSVASMMSTASTATAKGKKKAGGRTKKAPAKKTKETRTTRAKKVETEPEPEPEQPEVIEIESEPHIQLDDAELQLQDEFTRSQLEADDAKEVEEREREQKVPEQTQADENTPVQSPNVLERPSRQEEVEVEVEYPLLQQAAAGSPLQHKSSPYPHRSSPHLHAHMHTSPYPHKSSPRLQAHSHTSPMAALPTPPPKSPSVNSPSNSDIENAPPSSLPASSRPPALQASSSSPIPPTSAWAPVDLELIFQKTPGATETEPNFFDMAQAAANLSEREQNMTVQEWIEHIAKVAEHDLKQEAERVVTVFEREGARAMGVLEGVECL